MATAVIPKVFKNYINGEWVESRSNKAFENRNPANTDELIGMFPSATEEDVNAAVDAAKEAYNRWRLIPAPKRAEILFRAAEMLLARKEVGAPLMSHPDVSLVSFTGSTAVGGRVSEACAPSVKHCQLEMGGKNIIIVMDDANLDLAIDGAIWGGFGTTGQRCTAASRVTVHKKVYKEFVERFAARAKSLKVGDGLDPTTEMGPCINESQLQTVMEYVQIGINEGAKLVAGGHRLESGPYARGWFHEPTIFADCDPKMRIAQEEIFGPVVCVIPCNDLGHALEVANYVVYGLSASIYTRDVNKAFQAMRDIYTGIVYVNAPTIGAETHLPFGGTKQTGNGHREAGVAAIDFYSEWKTLYVDFSDRLQRAQIDTSSFARLQD